MCQSSKISAPYKPSPSQPNPQEIVGFFDFVSLLNYLEIEHSFDAALHIFRSASPKAKVGWRGADAWPGHQSTRAVRRKKKSMKQASDYKSLS